MLVLVIPNSGTAPGTVTLEIPKSNTLTHGLPSTRRVTNKFAGLRSRCTMPRAWASAIASHACSKNSIASGTARAPLRRTHAPRSSPCRYSITMYGEPLSSVPTSDTRATCSLLILTAARASRAKRSTASGLASASGSKNFSATRSSSCRWVAATTMPMPPWPSTRSIRNFPAKIWPSCTSFDILVLVPAELMT